MYLIRTRLVEPFPPRGPAGASGYSFTRLPISDQKGFAHPEPAEPLNEPFIATGVGAVCWRVLLPRSNSVLKSWIKASESSASKGFVRYCSRRQANEHG